MRFKRAFYKAIILLLLTLIVRMIYVIIKGVPFFDEVILTSYIPVSIGFFISEIIFNKVEKKRE